MRPARNLEDLLPRIHGIVARVRIRLEVALVSFEEAQRAIAASIRRVVEDDVLVGAIADIHPQTPGFRRLPILVQHRHRRIVRVDLARGQHLGFHHPHQRLQQSRAGRDPVAQRRTTELDTLALEDPFQAIQRQVIVVFAGQDMSQQSRPWQAFADRLNRQRTADHVALTLRTGVLDPRVHTHENASRHILELLTDVFADALEVAAAFPAHTVSRRGMVLRSMPRQMFGQAATTVSRGAGRGLFLAGGRRGSRAGGFRGVGGQPRSQVESQLTGIQLFRATTENPTPQRLQLRGQLADPTILFLECRQKLDDQLAQSLGIGGKLGLQFHSGTRV